MSRYLRGHTAAEADMRIKRPLPIDLPDYHEAEETGGERIIAYAAFALFIVFAIGAAVVIFGGLPA